MKIVCELDKTDKKTNLSMVGQEWSKNLNYSYINFDSLHTPCYIDLHYLRHPTPHAILIFIICDTPHPMLYWFSLSATPHTPCYIDLHYLRNPTPHAILILIICNHPMLYWSSCYIDLQNLQHPTSHAILIFNNSLPRWRLMKRHLWVDIYKRVETVVKSGHKDGSLFVITSSSRLPPELWVNVILF